MGASQFVLAAAAAVVAVLVVAGTREGQAAVTGVAVLAGALAFWFPFHRVRQEVRFDVDGRYLRVRNGARRLRIPLSDIEDIGFDGEPGDWTVPVVRHSGAAVTPLEALGRFRLLGFDNHDEVRRHLEALTVEWFELRRRWL